MNKVIRDGKVAVLYSCGFGAGWFSWNSKHPEILFDPRLVAMVEAGELNKITTKWVEENMGFTICDRGAGGLEIEWLPVGTQFQISEYDGSEDVRLLENEVWITA